MLALQKMAVKDDINNAMLFLKSSLMMFCMCAGLYD